MIEKNFWIRFMAPIFQNTVLALLNCIDGATKDKCTHLHLLISSGGGSVFHGVSVYNYLKGINMNVTTYNFGSADSIATILFCAGNKRICVPHSRFLIHPVSQQGNPKLILREKDLDESIKGMQIDTEIIAKIIAATTKQDIKKVEDDMSNSTTLNSEQAKEYGLATDIQSDLYNGDELYSIYENGAMFHYVPTPAVTQNGTPANIPIYNIMPTPKTETNKNL